MLGSTISRDPEPWRTTDENGEEFRAFFAHEDGVDENGNDWEGWVYDPRAEYDEVAVINEVDPYPWLMVDAEGNETRTHTAHEDGVDEFGNEWEGWTYSPRTEF